MPRLAKTEDEAAQLHREGCRVEPVGRAVDPPTLILVAPAERVDASWSRAARPAPPPARTHQ